MKKIAILQSNYIPWKGYFDLINLVDEFILYDRIRSVYEACEKETYLSRINYRFLSEL